VRTEEELLVCHAMRPEVRTVRFTNEEKRRKLPEDGADPQPAQAAEGAAPGHQAMRVSPKEKRHAEAGPGEQKSIKRKKVIAKEQHTVRPKRGNSRRELRVMQPRH